MLSRYGCVMMDVDEWMHASVMMHACMCYDGCMDVLYSSQTES